MTVLAVVLIALYAVPFCFGLREIAHAGADAVHAIGEWRRARLRRRSRLAIPSCRVLRRWP